MACVFLVGLMGPPAVAAPSHAQLPDSVIIPPGGQIEIAVATWYDWASSPSFVNAVQMALDDFGPIKGFNLHATLYDAGCSGGSGAAAANAIVANSKNVGAIGFICSGSVEGGTPILEAAGQVMLTASATRAGLGMYGPHVFNRVVLADPAFEGWDAKVSFLPTVLHWAREFRARYGDDPPQFAKYAYDATKLLLTHIDRVSIVDGSGNLIIDRAALAGAVRTTTAFPGVTDIIALDAAGDRVNLLAAVGTRYVSTTGADPGNDCTDHHAPCATVQRGVALADEAGDVYVGGGAYLENVVVGRQVSVVGGWDPTTWIRDLALYPTHLDGSGIAPIPGDWDGQSVSKVAAIRDNTLFKMGYSNYEQGAIEYAESTTGIAWTPFAGTPVLTPGHPGQWGEPVIRFAPGSDGSVLDGLGISGGQGLEAGGVHAAEASITIRNCTIHDNFAGSRDNSGGGGVLGAFQGKTLSIEDSSIVRNGALTGASGVRAHLGTLTMSNVLVARNHSSEGPALHLNGEATLTHLTIAGNDGGILHNPPEERLLAVRNSIVVDNGWAINEGPSSLDQVRYSDIEGGWLGAGNIDADPRFKDPERFDYHLSLGSPCVDTGLNTWAPAHDLDGDPRPLDGNGDGIATVDMGVDELVLWRLWLPKVWAQ